MQGDKKRPEGLVFMVRRSERSCNHDKSGFVVRSSERYLYFSLVSSSNYDV